LIHGRNQWIRENDNCRGHSLNRVCSGTTETDQWLWINDTSRNDRLRFHTTLKSASAEVNNGWSFVSTDPIHQRWVDIRAGGSNPMFDLFLPFVHGRDER
jgi:hypothetical protein